MLSKALGFGSGKKIIAAIALALLAIGVSASSVWAGTTIQAPPYLQPYLKGAYYYDYGPPGSDQGVELRVTSTGMSVLKNGPVSLQKSWARLFANWLMSQSAWPGQSDRTLEGVAKEIHCHANRWFLSDSSMNIEYNWADVEYAERIGCLMWSP